MFDTTTSVPLDEKLDKPNKFDEMVLFAEKLGNFYHKYTGIPFVRVDLYLTKNGIKFGEFTGTPNKGHLNNKYNRIFGKLWENKK